MLCSTPWPRCCVAERIQSGVSASHSREDLTLLMADLIESFHLLESPNINQDAKILCYPPHGPVNFQLYSVTDYLILRIFIDLHEVSEVGKHSSHSQQEILLSPWPNQILRQIYLHPAQAQLSREHEESGLLILGQS